MTMTDPDPILIEILIAFIIGAMVGGVVLGIVIGITPQPHCGVCVCP